MPTSTPNIVHAAAGDSDALWLAGSEQGCIELENNNY